MPHQSPAADEREIRRIAYFLWENEGRPEGRHDSHWTAACDILTKQRSARGARKPARMTKDGPGDTRAAAAEPKGLAAKDASSGDGKPRRGA